MDLNKINKRAAPRSTEERMSLLENTFTIDNINCIFWVKITKRTKDEIVLNLRSKVM